MKKYIKTAVLMLILSLIPAFSCQAEENADATFTYGNFEYHENEDGVIIDSYFGSEETVDIPAYIGNKQVIEIADYAFLLCNTVKTVNVPDSVTTIGEKAFKGAASIENINTVSVSKEETEGENTENPPKSDGETSGDDTDKTEQEEQTNQTDGIEQVADDSNPSDTDSKRIPISQTASYVTVDNNNHLILIDKEGNQIVLDDTQEYKIVDGADGAKIVNKKNEQVTIDEDGNVIIPGVERENASQTGLVIAIAAILLVVVLITGIVLFRRKRHGKNERKDSN